MSDVATRYDVKFINHYEEYEKPLEISFTAYEYNSLDYLVSGLSAFFSGDPYECFINGEKAELHLDHGLVRWKEETK